MIFKGKIHFRVHSHMTISKPTLSSSAYITESMAFNERSWKNPAEHPPWLSQSGAPHTKLINAKGFLEKELPGFLTREVPSDNVQNKSVQDFPTPFTL